MHTPPLLGERLERLLAGVDRREFARPLAPLDLGVERLGVLLAPEHLRAIAVAVAPADTPHDATVSLHALDAHRSSSRSLGAHHSPRRAIRRGRVSKSPPRGSPQPTPRRLRGEPGGGGRAARPTARPARSLGRPLASKARTISPRPPATSATRTPRAHFDMSDNERRRGEKPHDARQFRPGRSRHTLALLRSAVDRRTGRYVPGVSDHRPADDEYYEHDRTELFSEGDIFRDYLSRTRRCRGSWRRTKMLAPRYCSVRSPSMPDEHAVQAWIRRNEAARAEDRRLDLERSMAERLEEAIRLSRIAAELETNLRREPDVRTG